MRWLLPALLPLAGCISEPATYFYGLDLSQVELEIQHTNQGVHPDQTVLSMEANPFATYGIGEDLSTGEWSSLIRQLIHRGYLVQDIDNYAVLRLTPKARPLLRGEETVRLAHPRIVEKPPKKKVPRSAQSLAPEDAGLFDSLRALRKQLADEQGVPPYVVFGDATLVEMEEIYQATKQRERDEAG